MKIQDITDYGFESRQLYALYDDKRTRDTARRKLNMAIGRAIPKADRAKLAGKDPGVIAREYGINQLLDAERRSQMERLGVKECIARDVRLLPMAKAGESVVVKGRLDYSCLAEKIAHEHLDRENRWRAERGLPAINRPYTSAVIYDACVVCKDKDNPTWAEAAMQERMYTSRAKHIKGRACVQLMNKTVHLPHVGVLDPASGTVAEVELKRDLARGLEVSAVAVVTPGLSFAGDNTKGLTLTWVIADELRYPDWDQPPALAVEVLKASR